MRTRFISIVTAVFLSIALMGSTAHAAQTWSKTPETTVQGVAYAIDAANADLFEQLVDTRGVCAQIMDKFFDLAATPEGQAMLPPAINLIFASMGGHVQARSTVGGMLANETQSFVRYGVASGKFAGNPNTQSVPPSGMLANIFANASMGRKEIRNVGTTSYVDGRNAKVPFEVYDHGNGNTYPVIAQLQTQGNNWRVTGIENLQDLLAQISQEAAQ